MRSRRIVIALLAGFALLGGATVGAPNATAAGPRYCEISGTAFINPGLSATSRNFTNTFTGKFSNCQNGGKVKSATISESGKGKGGCSSATTVGTAYVRWNTGQTSVISLKTSGVGNLLYVNGKFTSGLFKGSTAHAILAFQANPVQCETKAGVRTAKFNGLGQISG